MPSTGTATRARRRTPTTPIDSMPLEAFSQRRESLLRALAREGNAIGLVVAGEADHSLSNAWRPNPNFEYLTGITDEPGAMLLLAPSHPVASRRVQLFLKPLNPELERWDGFRGSIDSALKQRYGITGILRTDSFPRFLLESARRSKRFACLHPLAAHTAPISPDFAIFRESAARIPNASIIDASHLLAAMRAVKSAAEVAMIQRAADITAVGFKAAKAAIAPGRTEFDVQEAAEHAYRTAGARTTAYRTIAGTGFNATVLHYHANREPMKEGELLVLDGCVVWWIRRGCDAHLCGLWQVHASAETRLRHGAQGAARVDPRLQAWGDHGGSRCCGKESNRRRWAERLLHSRDRASPWS